MNALSVPARQAALGTIMKSVFKLGFPEWTIWGIPLVGHEVGLSIAENDKGVDSLVNSTSFGIYRNRQRSLFADIFATYTLGPAYACAAILLRFEPHHAAAPRGDPSDIDRARLILDVLDRLDKDQVSSYRETVAKLRNLWQEAVDNLAQQGGGPPADGAGHADIDGFLAAALEIPSDSPGFKAFDSEHWLAAGDWLADLNTAAPKRSFNWDSNDVIVLLTAAWRARLENPEHTARIATNGSDLWRSAPDRGHNVRKPAGLIRQRTGGRRDHGDDIHIGGLRAERHCPETNSSRSYRHDPRPGPARGPGEGARRVRWPADAGSGADSRRSGDRASQEPEPDGGQRRDPRLRLHPAGTHQMPR